jgi:hypothetical protein
MIGAVIAIAWIAGAAAQSIPPDWSYVGCLQTGTTNILSDTCE